MTLILLILIIISSAVLALIVLIQNPKGGGLAGNIAGFSTQFMGVKQTTDILEKGTWLFGGIIAVLALASTLIISRPAVPSPNNPQQTQQNPTNNSGTSQPQ